jgi:hypothetical protein
VAQAHSQGAQDERVRGWRWRGAAPCAGSACSLTPCSPCLTSARASRKKTPRAVPPRYAAERVV